MMICSIIKCGFQVTSTSLLTTFLTFFLATSNRITESDRVTATVRSHICASEKAGSGNALEMAVQVRLPVISDNAFLIKGLKLQCYVDSWIYIYIYIWECYESGSRIRAAEVT